MGSTLVRQLSRWRPEGAAAPRQDVAERLGHWLNVNEAIALRTTQATVAAAGLAATRRAAAPADAVDAADAADAAALHAQLQRELNRVRGVLTQSITQGDGPHRPDPNDPDTEFALFHQRLNDQQRRMELSVEALRGHVRQALARSTPELAQLAALDAAMEPLFAGREQRLLSGLPAFLKARFVALRQQAAHTRTAAQTDATGPATDDLRWLQTFATEFEQLLLAELDLRLQPVMGLLEATQP